MSKAAFVVGIGASAGGLEALERFFDNTPINSGGAFIVVMHLSRDFKSMLDELLARHTTMRVVAALDGLKIEANTVYIIQRATILEVRDDVLRVTTRPSVDPSGLNTTIDTLFHSIARDWKDKGGAVVLSGSGSDGSLGVRSVHTAGGFVCAQSPETAKFDSMPVSTISSHVTGAVEAPENLAKAVIEGILLPKIEKSTPEVSHQNASYSMILDAIVGESNLDATKYKHSTFERRVRRRMMDLKSKSLDEYAQLVKQDAREARVLKDMLLIGVTQFFRDEQAFKVVEERVIPDLVRRAEISREPIRVWAPGCATGEEAYSLAMLFQEAAEEMPQKIEFQIFATDVKRQHLTEAGKGEYPLSRMNGVSPAMREKYFEKKNGEDVYCVKADLRQNIVFAPHDILSDPPFTRLDMIACRNLLIYFSMEAQQKVMSGFAFGLAENGFLFMGASETVGGHRDMFDFIDAKNRVFRRTENRQRPLRDRHEFVPAVTPPAAVSLRRSAHRARETALQPAYAALLSEYAPPCLMVSRDRDLLHSFGDAREFLRPPDGIAHLDATEMVDDALKTPMIAGIERVAKEGSPLTFSRIKLNKTPRPDLIVDLELRPLVGNTDEVENILIFIKESDPLPRPEKSTPKVISATALVDGRIEELELELDRTRQALQSTIEEIETTNEELQAANEELMSSNEELQSTNEELSSVNEELYSVNSEYHRQNDEISTLNRDFEALLQTTEIAVVFVDTTLLLTRFTSLASKVFGLRETDIGRSISLFRSPFVDTDPAAVFAKALEAGGDYEVEALDGEGASWLLRVVSNPGGSGLVLTAISINALRIAEEGARKASRMSEYLQRATQSFYVEVDLKAGLVVAEFGAFAFTGQPESMVPFKPSWEAIHEGDRARFISLISEPVQKHDFCDVFRVWHGETEKFIHMDLTAHLDTSKAKDRWQISCVNVNKSVESKLEAVERTKVLQGLLRVSQSMVAFVDASRVYQFANEKYAERWGRTADEIVGLRIDDVLPPKVLASAENHIADVLKGERCEFILHSPDEDGPAGHLSTIYEPVTDFDESVIGFMVSSFDLAPMYAHAQRDSHIDETLLTATSLSSLPVLLADAETGSVRFANDAALRRLGLPQQESLPPGLDLSRLTPEWGVGAWIRLFKSMKSQTNMTKRDVIAFDEDQNSSISDMEITLLKDGPRKLALVQLTDTGERTNAILDLRERSRQLAISNRDLEQFASAVAHDLRAPIRHISQFVGFLSEEFGDDAPEDAQEYISFIQGSTSMMTRMVESLLDYSRLGRLERRFKVVSLSDCVKSAQKLIAENIKETKAKITCGRLPRPVGDKDLLIRLLQNLIENSIKYSKAAQAPKIHIEGIRTETEIIISVSDNGIGIKPELSERVFALFGRLHADDEYSGLGVGLATCRRICELHGGKIVLDTDYTKGAKFDIYLPHLRS